MPWVKSNEPNIFHYITSVTFNRVPVFRSEKASEIFISTLADVREKYPFKLIGYVVMPDHFHPLVNPQNCDISKLLLRVRGLSARKTIDWLREKKHLSSLAKLTLTHPQKKLNTHSLWQKNPAVVDLYSHKFVNQKLNYIHLNPVRARLCEHPAEWRWSSYRAYFPHEKGSVPIEIDKLTYWKEDELKNE